MKPEILSLDFTGTIITMDMIDHFWNESIPKRYAEIKGISIEEAKRFVQEEYDKIGPRDLRWYFPKYWLERFGISTSIDELLEESWQKVKVFDDAERALPELFERYKVVIVSNASREFIEFFFKKKGYRVHRIFSTVSDLGVLSKDPSVYRIVSKELGTDSILHVGDDFVQDYLNPRMAGLASLLLNREAQEPKKGEVILSLEELLTFYYLGRGP